MPHLTRCRRIQSVDHSPVFILTIVALWPLLNGELRVSIISLGQMVGRIKNSDISGKLCFHSVDIPILNAHVGMNECVEFFNAKSVH